MQRRYEKLFHPRVFKALNVKVKGLKAALKRGGYAEGNKYLHDSISNPFLNAEIRILYKTVGVSFANDNYAWLRSQAQQKRFGFNAEWAQAVIDYLNRFLIDKITFAVTATQRDRLLKELTQGIQDGLSIDEMVKRLDDLPWMRFQTARIVRTEIKRASEVGNKVASDSFEFEQNKEWISIEDRRVRGRDPKDHADHLHMNGQTVDADGKFQDPRNGHQLLFPGDPDGEPEDTINCRCRAVYVAKRDQDGRLIPKGRSFGRVSVIRPGQIRRPRTVTI